jgi:phosphomannomutase
MTRPGKRSDREQRTIETPIKFGTDGWRAVIAREYTFDNVKVCAQAVADYLGAEGLAGKGLVIGYDTRFASEDFAAAAAGVLAGNGIHVYLCPKATPTPVISFGTIGKKAGGAVIITASHNPAAGTVSRSRRRKAQVRRKRSPRAWKRTSPGYSPAAVR